MTPGFLFFWRMGTLTRPVFSSAKQSGQVCPSSRSLVTHIASGSHSLEVASSVRGLTTRRAFKRTYGGTKRPR